MQGASDSVVRRALEARDPLPGTSGFAGVLDGALLRDVLGRYPLYSERDDPSTWSADPTVLTDAVAVPAGHRRTPDGDESIWTLPSFEPVGGVDTVEAALRRSFEGISTEGLAVAFSGGVDSALVAAATGAPLYVVGWEGSHDLEAARTAAELMGRELTVVEVDHDDIRRAVPEVVAATGRTNAMDVQIALPLYLVAERVAADGFDRLAVGQGADELFGGYAKVAKASGDPRVEAETVRGARDEVLTTLPDQLPRDVLTLRHAGVEPVAPLLHDAVVESALRLPGALLVDGETRKVALRAAARSWLPEEIATHDKKAVQYGSLLARELDRLARQNGFKRRMDDHVTRYIVSLVE